MDTLAHDGRFIQNNSKIFLVDQTNYLHGVRYVLLYLPVLRFDRLELGEGSELVLVSGWHEVLVADYGAPTHQAGSMSS